MYKERIKMSGNSQLVFDISDSKITLIRGSSQKEVSRDVFTGICQMVLSSIASRDYSSITSMRKLLRTIDLECEPDDSDDEQSAPEKVVAKPATKPATSKPAGKPASKPASKPAAKAAPKKAAPASKPKDVEESETSSDEESDED